MKKTTNNSHTRSRQKSERRSRSRKPELNSSWLQNFFSEMLEVERGGVQLYGKALKELSHDNLRSKLERFHQQTERHVELCEELLTASGGDESEPSPGAEAAQHKAQGLLSTEVPDEMLDINNIENLVLAETKDHWNWEMLGSLVDEIEDDDIRKVANRAVREVRKQEEDHLSWNQKTLSQLALEASHENQEMESDEEMEEEGARHE